MFADVLSRKPTKYKQSAAEQVTENVMFIEEDQFLNASVVAMETMRDPVLGMVLQFTQQGWRNNLEPVFQPYYSKRLELSHEDGILLWNSRVVVPESLQALLLADLHAEHLGMVKMKQLARKYFWLFIMSSTRPSCFMVLARRTMETITCRFCWALSWQDVFGRGGCLFQIFGDSTHDSCHQHQHYYCFETHF